MSDSFTDEVPPIHRLPDDILQCIFLLNNIDGDDEDEDWNYDTVDSIISSSQVCKRWRTAALQNRMVWLRFIDWIYSPVTWIEELLRRSDPCPFDFGDFHCGKTVDLSDRVREEEGDVLTLIFAHNTRLHTFCLVTTFSGFRSMVSPLFSCPVPILECLDVCIHDEGEVPDIPSYDFHPPLLRHLRIHQLTFNVTPKPILRSLLTLSVTQGWERRIGSYTITEWLGILADMPALQHLVIERAIVQDTLIPSEALYTVHLDHLERLKVRGPFHETMTLLSCLKLPRRCSFDFTMSSAVSGSDERILATFLEHNISSWEKDPTFRVLVVEYSNISITLANNCDVLRRKCVSAAKSDPLFHIKLYPRTAQDSLSLFLSIFPTFSPHFPDDKSPRYNVPSQSQPERENLS